MKKCGHPDYLYIYRCRDGKKLISRYDISYIFVGGQEKKNTEQSLMTVFFRVWEALSLKMICQEPTL